MSPVGARGKRFTLVIFVLSFYGSVGVDRHAEHGKGFGEYLVANPFNRDKSSRTGPTISES